MKEAALMVLLLSLWAQPPEHISFFEKKYDFLGVYLKNTYFCAHILT